MLSLLATFPFHIATLKLQSDCAGNYANPQFNGIPDLFDKIYTIDGLAGFYRAFWPSMFGIAFYRGAYFVMAGLIANLRDPNSNALFAKFSLQSLITILAGTMTYPLLVLKDRTQVQLGWQNS